MINGIPWWQIILWALGSILYVHLMVYSFTSGVLSAIRDYVERYLVQYGKYVDIKTKTLPFRERGL